MRDPDRLARSDRVASDSSESASWSLPDIPAFPDPEHYLARRWSGLRGWWKRLGERRALARCLRIVAASEPGPTRLCDCPCGPGRLFPLFARFGFYVIGVDASPGMVRAACTVLDERALAGSAEVGDVRDLPRILTVQPHAVACIRFAYYLDAPARSQLLLTLSQASRRWLIVQYKSSETRRGARNRAAGRNQRKFACSHGEIAEEIRAAGLRLARIETIGPGSDRVFVLAEKNPFSGVSAASRPGAPARPLDPAWARGRG